MVFDQAPFDLRCEWGIKGIRHLASHCDALIIVDVLSFSTAADIATARGAIIYPCAVRDDDARELARRHCATLAGPRSAGGYSLSPASFLDVPPGTRVVLPSPNGGRLSLAARTTPTLAGCLRNAGAVAAGAAAVGRRIGVIPAGERWPDGSLRPAAEDLVGAGAVLQHLSGSLSPEAEAAVSVYRSAATHMLDFLCAAGSGRELVAGGYARDVELAGETDVSACVPRLVGGAYVDACRRA
jgi:2-phosphosulfolactate phosphatase